jgi:hypothetical protein
VLNRKVVHMDMAMAMETDTVIVTFINTRNKG